jgi:hypothetical protein
MGLVELPFDRISDAERSEFKQARTSSNHSLTD